MFIARRVQDEEERRREIQADDDGVRDESGEGRDEEVKRKQEERRMSI